MSITFQDLNDQRGNLDRHRENSSRMAEAHGRYETTGCGSIEFNQRLDFGVTFVTEPCISYGSMLDVDDIERVLEKYADDNNFTSDMKDLLAPDNGTPMLPLCTGFVTDWDQDHKGYYTGAWCGVRIWYPYLGIGGEAILPTTPIEPQVTVIHSFRFSAIGMKNVPTQVTD